MRLIITTLVLIGCAHIGQPMAEQYATTVACFADGPGLLAHHVCEQKTVPVPATPVVVGPVYVEHTRSRIDCIFVARGMFTCQ